jgi:eukaryotic-like serine/threonine-protein kinase
MSNTVSSIFAVSFFTAILTSALVTGGMLYFTGNLKLPGSEEEKVPAVEPETIEASFLVGVTTSVAADVLKSRGLRLVVQEERADDKVPAGKICSQDPLAESVLNVGGEVEVVVSTGPDSKPVPDVVGKKMDVAKKLITEAGFQLGAVNESDTGEPGTVMGSAPKGGEVAEPGAAVDLIVAKGITVPKVEGMYVGKGKKALKEAGLKVGKLKWRYSDWADANIILSQEPEAETVVAGGTEIILTINPDD